MGIDEYIKIISKPQAKGTKLSLVELVEDCRAMRVLDDELLASIQPMDTLECLGNFEEKSLSSQRMTTITRRNQLTRRTKRNFLMAVSFLLILTVCLTIIQATASRNVQPEGDELREEAAHRKQQDTLLSLIPTRPIALKETRSSDEDVETLESKSKYLSLFSA